MRLFIILIAPSILFAGFSEFDSKSRYEYETSAKKPNKKIQKRFVKRKKQGSQKSKLLNTLISEDKKLFELLKLQEKNVIVRKKEDLVQALTRVEGVVLNSLLAMNVRPSKFIVRLGTENEMISGGELRCLGHSFQRRVLAHCDLLVLDDEQYKVDVDIWDIDGAEGIIADYFYSGEEKAFFTSSLASFLQGVLDASKDQIITPFGTAHPSNAKNKVMNGVMGIAGNAKDKISESGEKNLNICYVNSGKEVLVFFNDSLKLNRRGAHE